MLTAVFAEVPENAFDRCLELGAGDGYLSTLVARHARLLVATDIRAGRLGEHPSGTAYAVCDAELLPFRGARFDLIFSSHLLEHLPDLPSALAQMRAVLREDGLMVHLLPTRLWKLLDLGLFFPSQLAHVIETRTEPRARRSARSDGTGSTVKQRAPSWWRRSLWPPVHGVGRSNVAELVRFGIRNWAAEFEKAGLEVLLVRRRLPLHSPYRFGCERTRRFLESFGASSTVGFVLAHDGRRPRHAELFAEVSAVPGADAGLAGGASR